jgi:hypothetical protein
VLSLAEVPTQALQYKLNYPILNKPSSSTYTLIISAPKWLKGTIYYLLAE